MTPEEAKITLALCPPEDETNPDVPGLAEARELAAADTVLAGWWEKEKNFDQVFFRKLSLLAPPQELSSTIMRGGATIFYASRLIAETAGEETDDSTNLLDAAISSRNPGSALDALTKTAPAKSAPRRSSNWFWPSMLLLIGFGGILVLAGLFVVEYGLASKSPTIHSLSGTIAKLEVIAGQLDATTQTPPASGQTLDEMRKYLDEKHSPYPPNLAEMIGRFAAGANINVLAESWNYHSVSNFSIQSGSNLSYLLVFDAKEFNGGDIPDGAFFRKQGPFQEHIWSADGYIFIELSPMAAKP